MKNSTNTLGGLNLYLNIYGETIYYNIFDKNGYVVSKNTEQKFRVFYHRYSIIVILIVLLGDYFKTFGNTIIAGIAAVILSEIYFRFFFLKKLKCIKNFKRDKKAYKLDCIIRNDNKEKTIMKACAYFLLSILVIINSIQQHFNLILISLSLLISIYSIYCTILNIVAFIKMKKKII